MTKAFFGLVNGASRFWLPAVLNEIAKIPPSLCSGDGCSIFLKSPGTAGERLYLAATTRSERLSELFDERVSYNLDPKALKNAARLWKQNGRFVSPDASLTGWVAAFGRPLMIRNLHDDTELDLFENLDQGLPRPVWSEKNRGPQDHNKEVARPFLCTPMFAGDAVIGAIRVATTSRHPRAFEEADKDCLHRFGNALAEFLVSCDALARPGLPHGFRIWGASDVEELASRITEAVPALFDVECCSFFLRDPRGRFVLHNAATRHVNDLNFRQFVDQNRGRLYYKAGDGSKTSLCIDHQTPIVLSRDPASPWRIDRPRELASSTPELRLGSGCSYLDPAVIPDVTCEFPKEETRAIVLVPVPDRLSTHLPAGVLRILSTGTIDEAHVHGIVTDVVSFAQELGGVIGRAWRDDQQRRAQDELVRLSDSRLTLDERIAAAAKIACDAVAAAAVTIFLRDRRQTGSPLVTRPQYSVLADRYQSAHPRFVQHHERFKSALPQYGMTETARTAWVARSHKTLNLKDLEDRAHLDLLGIEHQWGGLCELEAPGPFLAVPVAIGPRARVEGVIRAVRRRGSEHGSFSLGHEEILATCGNVLATLLSTLRWKALVSYSTRAPNVPGGSTSFDIVKNWVEFAGGEVLDVVDRSDPNWMHQFADLCRRADVGITIATVDHETLLSENVEVEIQQMWTTPSLSKRRIVLAMQGVEYRRPELIGGAEVVPFPGTAGGITQAHAAFMRALHRVLADADAESGNPAPPLIV